VTQWQGEGVCVCVCVYVFIYVCVCVLEVAVRGSVVRVVELMSEVTCIKLYDMQRQSIYCLALPTIHS
jgi:hypothetical protein